MSTLVIGSLSIRVEPTRFPEPALASVLARSDLPTIARLSCVCRFFRQYINSIIFWEQTAKRLHCPLNEEGKPYPEQVRFFVKLCRKISLAQNGVSQPPPKCCYLVASLMSKKCYFAIHREEAASTQSIAWYQKSAEMGDDGAQNILGFCYLYGLGIPQNFDQAFAQFEKAAKQGNPAAQINLGDCYFSGKGVEKDLLKAAVWYGRSANQGHPIAQTKIGSSFVRGLGIPRDESLAFFWFNNAAEQGNAIAQFNLGSCYYYGVGVDKNRTLAFSWYRKAGVLGYPRAFEKLEYCYRTGTGVDKDRTQAAFWKQRTG